MKLSLSDEVNLVELPSLGNRTEKLENPPVMKVSYSSKSMKTGVQLPLVNVTL